MLITVLISVHDPILARLGCAQSSWIRLKTGPGHLADDEEHAQKLLRESVGLLGSERSAGMFRDEGLKSVDCALTQEQSRGWDHASVVPQILAPGGVE